MRHGLTDQVKLRLQAASMSLKALTSCLNVGAVCFEFCQVDHFHGICFRPALFFTIALRQCRLDECHFLPYLSPLLVGISVLLRHFYGDEFWLLQDPRYGLPYPWFD
jgi:hypothetical protein